MNEEDAQVPQLASKSLETEHIPATTIKELTITLKEQNKRIEELIRDNDRLRDELINLSRTFQMSKRDLQRVEDSIPKLSAELKTKFENMLETTESRIQGPIDRLLEELGRLRANPTPIPANQAQGDGSWAQPEDYNPSTGSYPRFRERPGSVSRERYAGKHYYVPFYSPLSTSTTTNSAPASSSAPVPIPATASTPLHNHAFRSQGPPLSVQHRQHQPQPPP